MVKKYYAKVLHKPSKMKIAAARFHRYNHAKLIHDCSNEPCISFGVFSETLFCALVWGHIYT